MYTGNMEQDLKAIAPYVVADCVAGQDRDIADWLVSRAVAIYAHNERWGKQIARDNERARDMLEAFMAHWLEGKQKREARL